MSVSARTRRQHRQVIEGLGYELLDVSVGGKHPKLTVRNPATGATCKVTVSMSPSDKRGLLNLRADLRRALKP